MSRDLNGILPLQLLWGDGQVNQVIGIAEARPRSTVRAPSDIVCKSDFERVGGVGEDASCVPVCVVYMQ